jgi:hypothetical protein
VVKIFEKHQQMNNISNYQTRIIQCENFEDYLQNIDMPSQQYEISYKHINYEDQAITFILEVLVNGKWIEHIHFAQVIE